MLATSVIVAGSSAGRPPGELVEERRGRPADRRPGRSARLRRPPRRSNRRPDRSRPSDRAAAGPRPVGTPGVDRIRCRGGGRTCPDCARDRTHRSGRTPGSPGAPRAVPSRSSRLHCRPVSTCALHPCVVSLPGAPPSGAPRRPAAQDHRPGWYAGSAGVDRPRAARCSCSRRSAGSDAPRRTAPRSVPWRRSAVHTNGRRVWAPADRTPE